MEQPRTLTEWTTMVERIYGQRNRNKNRSHEIMWLHVSSKVGKVIKDVRKEDFDNLNHTLPHVFIWLCAFTTSYRVRDLGETIWYKYPGICPRCFKEENCVCIARDLPYNENHDHLVDARKNLEYKQYSLTDWQNMFKRIYGNVNKVSLHSQISSHLAEEVDEVSQTLFDDERKACLEEIADVFAWICAVATKGKHITSLSDIVYAKYNNTCYKCRNSPCTCDDD